MKNFFSYIWWIILVIICLVFFSLGIFSMLSGVLNIIINIGGGSWLKGLIFLPFATIGIIQVIRGFFAVIEKDFPNEISYDSLSLKNKIFAMLYWIITVLSYAVLFIVIQNLAL